MSLIRALLLLVILAALAGLGLQNLSPSLSLVFLGLRSQPIPLTFLLLGAIAAGVITGLAILSLLTFANYLAQRRLRSRVRELEGMTARSSPRAASTRPQANYSQAEPDAEPVDVSGFRSSEAAPQPKTSYQSGTTYSYGYRDTNQSGVGQRESIFDAEYREVTPPSRSGEQNQDWDDDAFDWDEDKPTGSRR